jgi:hypothetical protein
MEIDPREVARKKIEQVISSRNDPDENAEAVIWAAVMVNAGLGVLPVGINMWTFVGVSSVMVVALGAIYGHHVTQPSGWTDGVPHKAVIDTRWHIAVREHR